jgi:hypothetical protein
MPWPQQQDRINPSITMAVKTLITEKYLNDTIRNIKQPFGKKDKGTYTVTASSSI